MRKKILTIKDIEKALIQLNKDKKLVKRFDKEGNWIELDSRTMQVEKIGFGKKALNELKYLSEFFKKNNSKKKLNIKKFAGIKIVLDEK